MAKHYKSVISASRRTDIPAYYLDWFIDRLKEAYVDVENPFNLNQVSRVSLLPNDVEWIVFWSRDYNKLLKKSDFISDYNLYFHFTINSESSLLSPRAPVTKKDAYKQAEALCRAYGSERVMWRFDPIFFYNNTSNYSYNDFKAMCKSLSSAGIKSCTTSFASPYKKIYLRIKKRNLDIRPENPCSEKKSSILDEMRKLCCDYGITLYVCSNDCITLPQGVLRASCINGRTLNSLSENKVSIASHKSRPGCNCTKSIDIGSYAHQPCKTGCLYCYANKSNM